MGLKEYFNEGLCIEILNCFSCNAQLRTNKCHLGDRKNMVNLKIKNWFLTKTVK